MNPLNLGFLVFEPGADLPAMTLPASRWKTDGACRREWRNWANPDRHLNVYRMHWEDGHVALTAICWGVK